MRCRLTVTMWLMFAVCAIMLTSASGKDSGRLDASLRVQSAILLGSPDFYPSPERPIGWRGDWTGRYPGATPPTFWGRWAKGATKNLRQQARKPKDGNTESARLMELGIIREWLLAGPFPASDNNKNLDAEFVPRESELSPDEGEKAGELKWRLHTSVGPHQAGLSFDKLFGEKTIQNGYAHTYLYSESGGKCAFNLSHPGGIKIWVNGKQVHAGAEPAKIGRLDMEFKQGWNRLLIKHCGQITNGRVRFEIKVLPVLPISYESKNIRWMTMMPGCGHLWDASAPLVLKDKVFVLVPPSGDLACLNRADGKILWMKSNGWWDAATPEEKERPAYRETIQPMVSKLEALTSELIKEMNAGVSPEGFSSDRKGAIVLKQRERDRLVGELHEKMRLVDEGKYRIQTYFRRDSSATPCTDGKDVYVWVPYEGVAARYDLDGNRAWIGKVGGHDSPDHGNHASPILVKGRFICPGNRDTIYAIDCKTGALMWKKNPGHYTNHSSLVPFVLDSVDMVLSAGVNGPGGKYLQASDGEVFPLWEKGSAVSTPIIENGMIYSPSQRDNSGGWYHMMTLPERIGQEAKILCDYRMDGLDNIFIPSQAMGALTDFRRGCAQKYIASPLYVDGLIYIVSEGGCLSVADAKRGKMLYHKLPDWQTHMDYVALPGCCSSPTLGGKHIYIISDQGTTMVLEPGTEYKEISKNPIEMFLRDESVHREQFMANPVFDGKDLFIRGQEYLYCIGEK